jgi:hypothetical protein
MDLAISKLNRDGYKFIGTGYDHGAPPGASWSLCNIIVLGTGKDKEALQAQDLEPLDSSIQVAMPILDGPKVWELW